jgi:hypothetical protein
LRRERTLFGFGVVVFVVVAAVVVAVVAVADVGACPRQTRNAPPAKENGVG